MTLTSLLNRTKRATRLETLKHVVNSVRRSETLDGIPERMATVIELFDNSDIDPAFRADIHDILSTAITIATAVSSPSYDSQTAIFAITDQQTLLAKLLLHLNNRPERIGYSILVPATRTMLGQFATEEEAKKQLASLSQFGSIRHAIVVPVKMTSMFAVRPSTPESPLAEDDDLPAILRRGTEAVEALGGPSDVLLGVKDSDVANWDAQTAAETTEARKP